MKREEILCNKGEESCGYSAFPERYCYEQIGYSLLKT